MHDRAEGAVYWQILPVPPSLLPDRADGKVFRVHREASRAVMDSAVHKFPESRRSPSCPRFASPRAYFRSARADPRLFRPARASFFRKNFLSTWRLILFSLHSKRFIRLVNVYRTKSIVVRPIPSSTVAREYLYNERFVK